jgi:hypothetical protein
MIPRYNIKQIKSKLQGKTTTWSDYIPPKLNTNPNSFDDGTIDQMYDEYLKSTKPQFMSYYVDQPYDGDAKYFFQLRGYEDLNEFPNLEKRINSVLFDLTGVFDNNWDNYTLYSNGVIEIEGQGDYLSVQQLRQLLNVLKRNTLSGDRSEIDFFYHADFIEYDDASNEWLLEGMSFDNNTSSMLSKDNILDVFALIAPIVDVQPTDTIISLPVEGDMMKLTRLSHDIFQIEYTPIKPVLSDILMKRVLQEYPNVTLFITAFDNDSFQFFKKYGFKFSDWSEVGVVDGIKLVRNPNSA